MILLKVLWQAGQEDACANVVAKLLGISIELAFYRLTMAFDE